MYVLRSEKTGRRYAGYCGDLDRRLHEHNSGHTTSTRNGAPWRAIYHETHPTRSEAVRRERYFKTGKGCDELDRLLRDVQLR